MTYTSNQVSEIAVVTLRQLQWWDEKRVVQPHHFKHSRVYGTQEVFEVAIIAALREREVSLQKIRPILRQIRVSVARYVCDDGTFALPSTELILIVDTNPGSGRAAVYITDDPYLTVKLLKTRTHPQHVISLTDLVERIKGPTRREAREKFGIARHS